MIQISVCAPMFRAKYIGWLAMEGLCRQKNIDFEWELIIAEEVEGALGEDKIMTYKKRLESVGCIKIHYIRLYKWIPLSDKYVLMVKGCSDSSKIFVGCAADIFSPPFRLKTQYDLFTKNSNVDFSASPKTIFYDIMSEKTFIYDVTLRKRKDDGSNRTFRMEIMKNLPKAGKIRGVDKFTWDCAQRYVASQGKKFKLSLDTSDNWKYGLNVHGLNNLSRTRDKLFVKYEQGVYENTVDISKTIPTSILDRLKLCKQYVNDNKFL